MKLLVKNIIQRTLLNCIEEGIIGVTKIDFYMHQIELRK